MKKYILMLTTLIMLGSCAVQIDEENNNEVGIELKELVKGRSFYQNNSYLGEFSVDGEQVFIKDVGNHVIIESKYNYAVYERVATSTKYYFYDITDTDISSHFYISSPEITAPTQKYKW